MIGYLRGKIKSIDFESVLVDVGGVGYGENHCLHCLLPDRL
jgi:Holliday junction resolvasome RuvABC DNA-binding subunit